MKFALIARNFENYTNRRITDVMKERGIECGFYDPLKIAVAGDSFFYNGKQMEKPDLALVRTSVYLMEREYILSVVRCFEALGIRAVNNSLPIEIASNKFHTFQALNKENIPVVPSIALRSRGNIDRVVKAIGGYPLMLKFFYGTQGTGVVYVESYEMLSALLDSYWALGGSVFLQPFVIESEGKCHRVLIAGERIIATALMIPRSGDFRSNYLKGGTLIRTEVDKDIIELAFRAKEALGLYFTGVDILVSDKGPLVLEVNSSPGIESIEKILKINLADDVATALLQYAKQH